MRLSGKAALVTGAGGGLGSAIARRYAAEGASVLCSDRDLAAAEKTVLAIQAAGGVANSYQADVAEPDQCAAQVEETVHQYGCIDILVNNAGVALHRLALDTDIESWDRVLRINLTGSFLTAQAAAKNMVAQGGGRIVQLGSISGQRGNMGGIAYGASKAAVMHVCKVLAVELSDKGIMVNAIAPGPIETGPQQSWTNPPQGLHRSHPNRRLRHSGCRRRCSSLPRVRRMPMDDRCHTQCRWWIWCCWSELRLSRSRRRLSTSDVRTVRFITRRLPL